MHEMNDDRIMSRTCLRQRSVIITDRNSGIRWGGHGIITLLQGPGSERQQYKDSRAVGANSGLLAQLLGCRAQFLVEISGNLAL